MQEDKLGCSKLKVTQKYGVDEKQALRARFFYNMHILLTSNTAQLQIPKNSGKIQLYIKEQLPSKSTVLFHALLFC